MKQLLILVYVVAASFTSYANNSTRDINYSNAFIFNEQGIEFAVFPDGQFDFNILDHIVGYNNLNYESYNDDFFEDVYVSFNSGYGYNPYIQFDDFGAIVQIQNVPIHYDYYGRVRRIGPVRIHYNYRGFVQRIGRLYVNYNANMNFHCHGYINSNNRFYSPRPWHRHYRRPSIHLSVVYDRPYRRHYTPVRRFFSTPYRSNSRPVVHHDSYRGRSNAVVFNNNYLNNSQIIDLPHNSKPIVKTDHNRSYTRSMNSNTGRHTPQHTTPSCGQTRADNQRFTPNTKSIQTIRTIQTVQNNRTPKQEMATGNTQTRSSVTRSQTQTRSQTRLANISHKQLK